MAADLCGVHGYVVDWGLPFHEGHACFYGHLSGAGYNFFLLAGGLGVFVVYTSLAYLLSRRLTATSLVLLILGCWQMIYAVQEMRAG